MYNYKFSTENTHRKRRGKEIFFLIFQQGELSLLLLICVGPYIII